MQTPTLQCLFLRLCPFLFLFWFGLITLDSSAQTQTQTQTQAQAQAQAQAPSDSALAASQNNEVGTQRNEAVTRLSDIQQSILDKRKKLDVLENKLAKTTHENEKEGLQKQIKALDTDIEQLNLSFEQIIVGGLDLEPFSDKPVQAFNWQEELLEAAKPIIDGIKDLTEKPRKIDRLRNKISLLKEQRKLTEQALKSIEKFQPITMPQWTRRKFESIAKEWQQQRVENESNLDIARFQLASLQGDDTDWWQSVQSGFSEFVVGRGLTLAIAIAAALSIWLLMRSLFWLYQKKLVSPSGRNSIHIRLANYAYRVLIWLVMLLAVVMTFYLAGDFLLLTLVIILLVVAAVSFRHILPLYLAEARLLLDIGPVRLGEKVVYEGLPMQVKSINVDSLLRNPDLKGIIRLPLRKLSSMVSRPVIDEPWFPCNAKDYILFSDGRYGQVLEQTLELVQVRMMGSVVYFPTADFFRMDFRNLSHMGFNVAVTFGVDYQHQMLCLDVIPERIHKSLAHAFTKAGFNDQTLNLQVDFKEAGASSLDYLIVANFKGEAADSYFSLGRLIQKTCVAVCNEEDWIIPFAQFTVHQGEGFQALNECHVPSSNAG